MLKCEETNGCKSVDYINNHNICLLSNQNSKTAPHAFYQPCYDRPNNFQYSEIIVLKKDWGPKKMACMSGHQNMRVLENQFNLKDCQVKCEAESECKSVDYQRVSYDCYLSKESSKTAPKDFHEPCFTAPSDFEYAEIISTSNPDEPKCGVSSHSQNRIVGGQKAKKGEWPWQVYFVYVDYTDNKSYTCGGTLIHKKWVLTAAHCTDSTYARSIDLVLGEHTLSERNEFGEQRIKVKRIINHEKYKTGPPSHDFALLELETEAEITDTVRTICLPKKFQHDKTHFEGQTCQITGWGRIHLNEQGSDILKEAGVQVYQQSDCKRFYYDYEKKRDRINNSMFCAGVPQGGTDSCQGDSGGPLQCPVQQGHTKKWYLWGVTSWGFGCADAQYPGVYGGVTEVLEWIEEKTGISY